MSIIKKIKYRIRLALLRRSLKTPRQNRQVMGYDQAATMALLYDLPTGASGDFIARFIGQLKSDGKQVDNAGLYCAASFPADIQVPTHLNVFCKKDFRWDLRPAALYLKELIEREYDLLLDLSSRDSWPMKLIAAASRAKYKVGAHHPDFYQIYDLIIKVDAECKDEDLAAHAVHYLKIIKTPEPND